MKLPLVSSHDHALLVANSALSRLEHGRKVSRARSAAHSPAHIASLCTIDAPT